MSKLDSIFSWLWPWRILAFECYTVYSGRCLDVFFRKFSDYEATRRHIPDNNILHEPGCCEDQVTRTGLQTGVFHSFFLRVRNEKCVKNCTCEIWCSVCWDVTTRTLLRGIPEFLWNLLHTSSGLVKQFLFPLLLPVYGNEHNVSFIRSYDVCCLGFKLVALTMWWEVYNLVAGSGSPSLQCGPSESRQSVTTTYGTTWRPYSEDHNTKLYRCENHKSHTGCSFCYVYFPSNSYF